MSNSVFGQALESGLLAIPEPSPIHGTTSPDVPFVIVGDEAFPLKANMMRPYPGRFLTGKRCYLCIVQ